MRQLGSYLELTPSRLYFTPSSMAASRPRSVLNQGAARGPRRRGTCALARRLWKADRRRNRKVGQGDPSSEHQAGDDPALAAAGSINPFREPRVPVYVA